MIGRPFDRIAHVSAGKHFALFDALGVDERRGDRLLVVGLTPDSSRRAAKRGPAAA
jgi:hypothetical protein